MGESSSFPVCPFSQQSPTSQGKKENSTQCALTSSISFGRFMSESLDWGKWSVFTHNRHLEDVERYSRPGAVAEKKAYFEAHFKRRRAEKLLEQENAALREHSDADSVSPLYVNMEQRNGHELNGIVKEEEVYSNDFQNVKDGCSNETTKEDSSPMEVEPCAPVKVQQLDLGKEASGHKRCSEDGCTLRGPASSSGEKQEVFACSPFVRQRIDQLKDSRKSPDSKNTSRDSRSKRPSSIHMSFNLGRYGGIQKYASPRFREVENCPSVTRPPAKSYKSRSHCQTSSRVPENDMFRGQSTTVLSENERTLMQRDDSVIRNDDIDSRSASKRYSQAANKFGSSALSPQFSSFTFKTEERAEKRKEFFQKLEEKLKLREADKQQMHVKSQARGRSSYKDLHDTLMFRTEKFTDGTSSAKMPSNLKKETPTVSQSSSKAEEGIALKAQDLNSRPPWRFSSKVRETKDTDSKNHAPTPLSHRSFSKRSMTENASPNIYH